MIMMMKMKYGDGEEEDYKDDESSWNNPPKKKFDSCCLFLGDNVLFLNWKLNWDCCEV